VLKKVSYGGREYLVAQVAGKYYCTDLRCPHMGGDLSKGTLQGTIIKCPMHASQFDLTDGHVVNWVEMKGLAGGLLRMMTSPRPLKIYEARADGDRILIKV